MNFKETQRQILKENNQKYIGLYLDPEKQFLHFFGIEQTSESRTGYELYYSASFLFDMSGEEGNYDLEHLPVNIQETIQHASFKHYDEITDLFYMIPAQILYTLFPELPNPVKGILCPQTKKLFAWHADELIKRYWK